MHRLFDDQGEYIPCFFKISINKELSEGIQWENFSTEEKATLVHEYIHFLQDISLCRGLSNFIYLAKRLQLYLYNASQCNQKIFLPMDIENCAVENAYAQSELMSFYSGNNFNKRIHHINAVTREQDEIINSLEFGLEKLFSINIYYDDKKTPYVFGSDCVTESMAYLIESHSFGACVRKNELLYNSCELICQQIYPELLNNIEVLVAICELSLMHYHSGDMFWNIICHIRDNALDFSNINEVETYFNSKTQFLVENLQQDMTEGMEVIDFLYPPKLPNMSSVNKAVKEYVTKGNRLRKTERFFIARLTEAYNKEEVFLKLMNEFGLPIISDNNNQFFSGQELSMMIVPIAIFNIFDVMAHSKCYIYNFCMAEKLPLINLNCLNAPWKQSEKEKLCPFAAYWYFYSLDGKEIEKQQ